MEGLEATSVGRGLEAMSVRRGLDPDVVDGRGLEGMSIGRVGRDVDWKGWKGRWIRT